MVAFSDLEVMAALHDGTVFNRKSSHVYFVLLFLVVVSLFGQVLMLDKKC
jgi:hypothetical protein